MTALIIHAHPDGFDIYSDTAAYSDDGVVRALGCKVALLPTYSGFITARGSDRTVSTVLARADQLAATFDGFKQSLPDIAKDAQDAMTYIADGVEQSFAVYFGGWSEAQQRFEAYSLYSEDRDPAGGIVPEPRAGFVLYPLDRFAMMPGPPDADLEAVGVLINEELDTTVPHFCARIMQAQRQSKAILGPHPFCSCGGSMIYTYVQRRRSGHAILHDWSDRIGGAMEPHDGELGELLQSLDRGVGEAG